MCLNIGVTILASTKEIQLVLSSQCTIGAAVWGDKAYMYLRKTLVFLTAFYMHILFPSVESEAIHGLISNLIQTETLRKLLRIPETDRFLLIILA